MQQPAPTHSVNRKEYSTFAGGKARYRNGWIRIESRIKLHICQHYVNVISFAAHVFVSRDWDAT